MLTLTQPEVEQITKQLLKGNVCFYQIDKKKVFFMPDDEDYFDYDLTAEEESLLDAVEESPDNYAEFTKMEPAQEYQMMQDFVDRFVNERTLAEDLVDALGKPKANTAFKFVIEASKYNQQWKEYRESKYLDWVLELVDSFNFSEN